MSDPVTVGAFPNGWTCGIPGCTDCHPCKGCGVSIKNGEWCSVACHQMTERSISSFPTCTERRNGTPAPDGVRCDDTCAECIPVSELPNESTSDCPKRGVNPEAPDRCTDSHCANLIGNFGQGTCSNCNRYVKLCNTISDLHRSIDRMRLLLKTHPNLKPCGACKTTMTNPCHECAGTGYENVMNT